MNRRFVVQFLTAVRLPEIRLEQTEHFPVLSTRCSFRPGFPERSFLRAAAFLPVCGGTRLCHALWK